MKKKPKNYWNYRLLHTKGRGFFFAEVHYQNDIPTSYGEAQRDMYDSKKWLKWQIKMCWHALKKPTLDGDVNSENFLKPLQNAK